MPDFGGFPRVLPAKVRLYHANINTSSSYTATNTFADVVGLSLTINPFSPGSTFLVRATVQCGSNYFATYADLILVRNTTNIGQGDTSGGIDAFGTRGYVYLNDAMTTSCIEVLDTPGAEAALPVTYKVQMKSKFGATAYVNQDHNNSYRGFSSLTVMEFCL